MTQARELPRAEVQVLLPAYNRRAYLREAIDSVLAQTYRDFHVLVIDDASTDGTSDVAREYERRFPGRVTALCKKERRGVAHSVNLGIHLTRDAPYVAFQNDDDVWAPAKLAAQIETFRQNPHLGLVATEAEAIDGAGRSLGMLFSDVYGKPDLAHPARHIFTKGNCLCAPSVVAARTGLDLVQPYYPLLGGCEDMYMWLVISAHMPIAWLDTPLTYWRRAAGQMTVVRERQMWRDTYALRDRLFRVDEAVRSAVGGDAARRRLDGDALYRAHLYLRQGDLLSYAWFSWQVLKRRSLRLAALLAFYTARALVYATTDLLRSTQQRT